MDHTLTDEELQLLKERDDWLYWNWYTQSDQEDDNGV